MIKTIILGLNEDEPSVDLSVITEMTIGMIEIDDTDDTETVTERGGTRLMKSAKKGGGSEGREMIGIVIDPENPIGLTPERGVRGVVVESEI